MIITQIKACFENLGRQSHVKNLHFSNESLIIKIG